MFRNKLPFQRSCRIGLRRSRQEEVMNRFRRQPKKALQARPFDSRGERARRPGVARYVAPQMTRCRDGVPAMAEETSPIRRSSSYAQRFEVRERSIRSSNIAC